jgi:hypothetical protein
MKRILTLLLLTISIYTFGQVGQEGFKNEVDNIYNFHPHKLSKLEQQEKFPPLDKFFEMIKSDTAKYLPQLRQELKSNNHFPYFYYDCSHLLMIMSKSQSDKELSAEAFSKCNIKDLDPKIYVSLLKILAKDNINITKAAIKILEDSTFHFYLIEHGAFDFMQGYCLMYCLLPLDPNLYVDTLIKYFQQTKDITAQKSIVTTLWFSYSCLGDKFLQSLNESNTLKKEVSEYAQQLLADNKLDRDYKKMLKKIKPNELEEMKKSALKSFSDEAIYDLDFVTKARRQKLNCR